MMPLIEDYRLEELLREPETFLRLNAEGMTAKDLNWRHLVQHSIGHAINAYFQLPPEERVYVSARDIVAERYTNQIVKFESGQHYLQVREKLLAHLVPLLEARRSIRPVILFESHRTHLPELDLDLSVIFQLMHEAENGGWVLEKIIADEDRNVCESYRYLAIAFCHQAFSRLPERIVTHCVLSGHSFVTLPDERMLQEAYDYLRLVRGILPVASRMPTYPMDSSVH
jgi:hypothetical protein